MTASSISDDSADDPSSHARLGSANKYLMKDLAQRAEAAEAASHLVRRRRRDDVGQSQSISSSLTLCVARPLSDIFPLPKHPPQDLTTTLTQP